MLSKILRGTVLATFAVGATVAQADVFTNESPQTLTWNTFEFGSVRVNVTDTAGGGQGSYGANGGGYGGEFSGYYGLQTNQDFFRFFCIELQQFAVSSATYWRSPLDPNSDEAKQLSYLFSKYYPNAVGGNDWSSVGSNAYFGNFQKPTLSTSDADYAKKSGAMQLAVWEIMFEQQESTAVNGLDLDTGNFTDAIDGAGTAHELADSWLNDVWDNYKATGVTNWRFYKFESPGPAGTTGGGRFQNYIAATTGNFDVPLPGTLALLGIGLAGLGLARRKS